jgi:hypothetical protein
MVAVVEEAPAEEIDDRLKRIVHGRAKADVVTLQFIGVEAARAASGAMWKRRWTRLRRTAEELIRERLALEDILVRAADGFVIVYGKQNGSARCAAADLAEELNRLFRAEAALSPQLAVSIQTISVDDLARSIAQGTPGQVTPPWGDRRVRLDAE